MLSGDKFLAALEPKDLVPSDVLTALWRQVRQSPRPIDASVIAQWLVERKHLTRDQADALLAEAGRPAAGGAKPELGKLPGGAMQSLLDEELPPIEGAGGQPLDALMAAGAMDEAEGDVLGEPPPPKRWRFRRWLKNLFRRDRSQVVRVRQADPRQVKILVGSWGVAVALTLGAFAAFWYFSPPGPGQMIDQADSAYKAGDYEEAIRQVDVFLEAYPKDERTSRMRMLRGLAELRAGVEAARADGNWLKPCESAHALMGKLPSEITYAEWQGEIGSVLATLAEGMARQARQSPDSKIVNQARGVLRLIESKVAVNEQPREKLGDVNRLLAMSESRVARDEVLQEAVTAIETAVDDGLPMAAYRAALTAIKQHPELAGNEALVKALKPAGEIQRKAVKMVDRPQGAQTTERAGDVVASVALGVPTVRGSLPSGRDRLLFVPWQGATHCLDAGTGRLRWRRFVAAAPAAPVGTVAPGGPVRLGTAPDEDVILVDPVEHELLRVETTDGRLVWRSPIGKPLLADPVRAGNRLLAPTVENRLVLVNLLGGDSPGYLQMPQPIRLAPVVDVERSLIYQVCDSSTLLVLSLATWKCEQVIYLGHAEGAVVAPPVVVGNFLLVAVNEGPGESVLHVFHLGPEGKGPGAEGLTCVQQVRMRGTISGSPVVQGARVAVVTDQGNVQVFLVDDQKPKSPLSHFARSEAAQQESLVRYALFLGNRIWVADRQLGRYEIQTADSRVVLRWITDQNSRFVQPLASAMGAVIHVRVRQDMPGVLVSAVRTESHEPIWQTWIGAPLAAEPRPSADGNALTALTAGGAMFRFDLKGVKDRATSSTPVMAVDAVKLTHPLVDVVPLEGGGFAMTAGPGGKQIFIYDPKDQEKRFRSLVSPQVMAASPVALAGGILVPCRDGQVFLLDTQSSQQRAKAFQPSLKIDSPWNWTTPAALGANEVLLCDGDRRLYRLRLEEGQEPGLVEAAAAKASERIVGGVAVLGKTAFAIGAKGEAMAFGLPDLAEGKLDPAGDGPTWGPWLAGQCVLVATEKNRLCCYNARRELAWTVDLKYGVPVGRPLAVGDDIFLASRQGTVWRIAAADGTQLGKVEAACPLSTGPVLAGQRLFVGTPDGCLLELKRP